MNVLSHYQTKNMEQAKREGADALTVSLDLNRSQSEVKLDAEGVTLPDGTLLSWETLADISAHETACYVVQAEGVERISFFSEALQRACSLFPTENAPSMLLAGFPMHRIKNIDPQEDTRRKIQTVKPVVGTVLDTTMGLGYTAIMAAQTAERVLTIELDEAVVEVARRNPWSQELFTNPRIERRIGDSYAVIQDLEEEAFTRIFHDPPTFQLAGDLYSATFYRQLRRVLKRGGRLFHYIGDLDSPTGGRVAKGAVRRLQDAGFQNVRRVPEAFGLVCF